MAIKIYKEGASAVVDDGTEVIISSFSYEEENEIITILDQESFNNVWNDYWYRLQKKDGSPCGATLSAVLDYLATVTSGEGGGSSVEPSDAFSINRITTDFQYTQSQISNGASIGIYFAYGEVFRLDCSTKIESFDIKLNSLGGTTTARLFSAIYKLDPATQTWNLEVECPSEFNVGSGGVVGWNKITLSTPHTLQPGVYMRMSTGNENAGAVGYPNHDGFQCTGWVGTGTSQTPYRHLRFNAVNTYHYPAPATFAVGDLSLQTSATIMKVFNTTTN